MALKSKFERIDQSKLKQGARDVLAKMKEKSENFTNAEVNKKIEPAIDKLIERLKKENPDALKKASATRTRKPKATAKKKATKKAPAKTSGAKRETVMTVAKRIRKDGEKWQDALKRARSEMGKDTKKKVSAVKTEVDKLKKLIETDAVLKGFANSELQRDAVRKAKPRGKRKTTTKGETTNQYGTFKNKVGRTYWESRENRSDRYAPKYPKNKPFLEMGGDVTDAQDLSIANADFLVMAKGGATSSDTSDVYFFAYEEFMKNGKKFKSEKELYDFVNDGYSFPKYSKKSVKSAFNTLNKEMYAKGGEIKENEIWLLKANIKQLGGKDDGIILKEVKPILAKYKGRKKTNNYSELEKEDLEKLLKTNIRLLGGKDSKEILRDSFYMVEQLSKKSYANGGEIASAIFNPNSKKGKISTSFGDKTKEGLTAMIENDSYSAKEIANAIFEYNEKRDRVETNYGDKTKEGLISMIESARDSKMAKGGLVKKYKVGDMWSEDFDYEGMLMYGKKINDKTSMKDIEKYAESLQDVNYHTLAKPLFDYEVALSKDKDKKRYFLSNFKRKLSDELQNQGYGRLEMNEIYNFKKGGEIDAFTMSMVKGVDDGISEVETKDLKARMEKGGSLPKDEFRDGIGNTAFQLVEEGGGNATLGEYVEKGIHNYVDKFYAKGGRLKSALMRDRKYYNKNESWERSYSKGKNRRGYKENGGTIENSIQSYQNHYKGFPSYEDGGTIADSTQHFRIMETDTPIYKEGGQIDMDL